MLQLKRNHIKKYLKFFKILFTFLTIKSASLTSATSSGIFEHIQNGKIDESIDKESYNRNEEGRA